MKRLNMLALLALVVFAGCGDDIDILIVDDDDQQSSDTTKAPIISTCHSDRVRPSRKRIGSPLRFSAFPRRLSGGV